MLSEAYRPKSKAECQTENYLQIPTPQTLNQRLFKQMVEAC